MILSAGKNRTKLMLLVSVFIIPLTPVFSEKSVVQEIEELILKGIDANGETIRKRAWDITMEERKMLVMKHSKQILLPSILNIFLGFGVGSYLQGDKVGGILGSITGVSFYSSLTVSLVYLIDNPVKLPAESYFWFSSAVLTGIIYAAIEVLRPVAYARVYNDKLWDILMAKDNVTLNFFPMINRYGNAVETGGGGQAVFRF